MVKNLSLKLLSVVIALLLSLYARSQLNSTVLSFFVQVQLDKLPHDRVIIWPINRQAQVTVRGPSYLVSELVASPPRFKIDMPKDLGDEYVVALNKGALTLPSSVEVLSVEPSEMNLVLDKLVTRVVPVMVSSLGEVEKPFKLVSIDSYPDEVRVTGPETELKDLSRIVTSPVDLRKMEGSFEVEVQLKSPGSLSQIEPQVSKVKVNIERIQDQAEKAEEESK